MPFPHSVFFERYVAHEKLLNEALLLRKRAIKALAPEFLPFLGPYGSLWVHSAIDPGGVIGIVEP
jgi:hypothetical protein